jgi:bifunctional UDP-N-acetylglucosamine pyrophosphorylase/glucosamine-1-phosphate N-acetyltransferase
MRQHRVRLERGDAVPLRPEADKDAGDARRPRRIAVGRGIADHHRAGADPAGAEHGFRQMPGIGLAHRQRIGAEDGVEAVGEAEFGEQAVGEPLRLVGADPEPPAAGGEEIERRLHTGIEAGMVGNRFAIVTKQIGIEPVDERLVGVKAGAREAETEHRPPARQRGGGIGPGLEPRGDARRGESRIRGGDQVGRGIGEGAVEIEDDRAHAASRPPPATSRPEGKPARMPRGPSVRAPRLVENGSSRKRPSSRGNMPRAVILLAAGQGTRMRSDLPKVLHHLAGAPLLHHAMAIAAGLEPDRLVVVTGHGHDAVAAAALAFDPTTRIVRQAEQKGTGHAVRQAEEALAGFEGVVFVLYADTPLIRAETLLSMETALGDGAAVAVLGFHAADPGSYGRLVTDSEGGLEAIVEAADARPEDLALTLCNSGVVAAESGLLFDLLREVRADNAKGEYYLTDIVALARSRGHRAAVTLCPEEETIGVNSRADLAAAEAAFQRRARADLLAGGVSLVAPETVFLAHDTVIGRDVTIAPHVVFGPGVTIETGARIESFCHLEGCHVSAGARIGPFARLRPGAEIADGARIGNFVEVKNALVAEQAKVNHLSYVGDAELGARANVGAGTITCNYDGVSKHRTRIGEDAFIGSNTALVAPVSIGRGAVVGAGSTITADVPDGALALARARQETKPGLAARLMERLREARRRGMS